VSFEGWIYCSPMLYIYRIPWACHTTEGSFQSLRYPHLYYCPLYLPSLFISTNAGYTSKDASKSRPVCPSCVYGGMHQTRTSHHRQHRGQPTIPRQQFSLDAYTPTVRSATPFACLSRSSVRSSLYPKDTVI
jgi:hypothetical protein